jgi:serine/threonine-protein phosphatase with EF-hand domain
LYRKRSDLETIFRCIDKDNSGYLTLDEFEEACTVVSHHTEVNFPPNYAHDLANSMDLDKDGRICFNEFLECFRIVDNEEKGISPRRGNIENSTV